MNGHYGLTKAKLYWDASGVPHSVEYGDRYFSSEDGLEETRWVFLNGNDLPKRWQNRSSFVIAELGFGTGLNFLASWREWKRTTSSLARFHYISFELHPLDRDSIERAISKWPELKAEASELLQVLPPPLKGFNFLELFNNCYLTLVYGDAKEYLPQLRARVDCWFLDGFSPAKNPDLWKPELFKHMAAHSQENATISTFSVAAAVVAGLSDAGFTVEKIPGYGRKREMLRGKLQRSLSYSFNRGEAVAILGAGLAGSALARSFSKRNWQVHLFEKNKTLAAAASGNPFGLLMPHISLKPDPLAQYSLASLVHFQSVLKQLLLKQCALDWNPSGVLRLTSSPRLRNLYEDWDELGLPEEFSLPLSEAEIFRRFSVKSSMPGIFFPACGFLSPPKLCLANVLPDVQCYFGKAVSFQPGNNRRWGIVTEEGKKLSEVDLVVIASGAAGWVQNELAWLPLEPVRGQIAMLSASHRTEFLSTAVCYDGYITPASSGQHLLGATFKHDDYSDLIDESDNDQMLFRLQSALPEFLCADQKVSASRVSFRMMSRDRLPIVGELPNIESCEEMGSFPKGTNLQAIPRQSGLFVSLGHGSRGISSSLIAAEVVAAIANDEPLPLAAGLVDAIDPARFPAKLMRQGILPTMANLDLLKVPSLQRSI